MPIRTPCCVLCLVLGIARVWAADPPASPARLPLADFKLVVTLYGVGQERFGTSELVVRHGRVFQFNSDAKSEVIIHDPTTERVELLDLDRMLQTELTWKALEAAENRLRKSLLAAIEKREREGGRANLVAAGMSRDLVEPRFRSNFDPKTNHLRLTNPTVEVDAVGEPEDDPVRRAFIANILSLAIKLDAKRNPAQVPPFTRLEALRALSADHKLRPAETSYLFRLAGPPKKLRWTYRLVPALTDRELEALARINRLREKAPRVRFERYENP